MIKHHNSYNGDTTLNNNTQTHRRTDCHVHLSAFPSYFSITHTPHHTTPYHTIPTSHHIIIHHVISSITQLLTFIFIFILYTARHNSILTETKLKIINSHTSISLFSSSIYLFYLLILFISCFYSFVLFI